MTQEVNWSGSNPYPARSFGPYPLVDREKEAWLTALLKGMVASQSDVVRMTRIRERNDIEYRIELSEPARAVFTNEVCDALRTIVAVAVSHPAPVLRFYIDGRPLPHTIDSLNEELRYHG